jgi:abhydrolase domain-containing protein 14
MSALHWSLVAGLAGLGLVAPGCRETGGESGGEAEASPRSAPGRVTVCSSTLLGGALHVREAGPEAGPVVILLHGMRYSAATWDELGTLSLLGARGYRALALDWPGFGATPEWNGAPDAATLLASVLNDLGADRVALVGASMGGGSALEFLAHSPQRVAAFVGLAPAGSAGFAPQEWATPTLLVWGERDEVLPLATGRALAGRLNARLEVLPGASHAAYLEQVEPFHAVLLAFLADSWPVAGRR